MEGYLIPLGFRCNAALITKNIVNQQRFVFDWVQMDLDSMLCVINLKSSKIRTFWELYFKEINETNHHKYTDSWFPHDKFLTEEDLKDTIEKYVRRTVRLHHVLKSNMPVFFLIFHGYPDLTTVDNSKEIIDAILIKKPMNASFIVCNSCYRNEELDNIYLLYEPLFQEHDVSNKDWDDLTERITTRVKLLFKEKNIQIIPFQSETS